jgi:hypothetical protein
LGIWNKRVLNTDNSGLVLLADLINISIPVENLNRVGLAELILKGGGFI